MYFLDTHIVVWLYQNPRKLLSEKEIKAINENTVHISPVVLLELEYLFEIKRINKKPDVILNYLKDKIGLEYDNIELLEITQIAAHEKWTRDPFDRLIVAHCKIRNAFLISKDKQIKKHYLKTL